MIAYTPEAERQVDALRQHYENIERVQALRALDVALDTAERTIQRTPETGLAAPRPYPELAAPGRAWIKAGRYWIAYSLGKPPVIVGVFYDAADIPGRAALPPIDLSPDTGSNSSGKSLYEGNSPQITSPLSVGSRGARPPSVMPRRVQPWRHEQGRDQGDESMVPSRYVG